MPVCARAVELDGALVLVLDPTVKDLSTCPYVVEDGASNAWKDLGNLSIDNAHTIGVSVGLVWAGVWMIKAIAQVIAPHEKESIES